MSRRKREHTHYVKAGIVICVGGPDPCPARDRRQAEIDRSRNKESL